MSRVQLALNVPDIDEAIAFYAKLFATEPTKVKPGYANFAVADPPLKLVLFEKAGAEVLGQRAAGERCVQQQADSAIGVDAQQSESSPSTCALDFPKESLSSSTV
jgi:catechol 2,3-dioxygenase-like lactoylglutathione lyase family enzyme